jgi:sirohydrochlorin ferrochelatase
MTTERKEREMTESALQGGSGTKAVILIGHGSRAAGADDDMERIAAGLRQERGGIVETCRMGGRGLLFDEALDRCVRDGAREILVLPYFLHFGIHLREDIPEILRRAAQRHPGVKLALGRHLGFDESLVRLVAKRIDESEGLPDIRETTPEEGKP